MANSALDQVIYIKKYIGRPVNHLVVLAKHKTISKCLHWLSSQYVSHGHAAQVKDMFHSQISGHFLVNRVTNIK